MFFMKLIRTKILSAKIPIATVNAMLNDIDSDGDGCVSVMEIINGVKRLSE